MLQQLLVQTLCGEVLVPPFPFEIGDISRASNQLGIKVVLVLWCRKISLGHRNSVLFLTGRSSIEEVTMGSNTLHRASIANILPTPMSKSLATMHEEKS